MRVPAQAPQPGRQRPVYPDISAVTFLDNNERFLELARSLAAQSEHPALRQARALDGDINNLPRELSADLVVAAYALAELPLSQSGTAAASLWRACKNTLLIIEPGTPQGFARIASGAHRTDGRRRTPRSTMHPHEFLPHD